MEDSEAITKRLSFGEVSQHLNATQQLDVQDVIKALKHPSVDNFQRAFTLLHGGCQKRFSIIQETAKEQSAAVGDADLRRMKRQFSSLKNTFLHYEVKDEFIAALADGLPNGTEEIQLTQFEEELARNVDLLRSLKGRNAETQEEIAGFISQIGTALEELDKQKSTSASILSRLQQEMEQDKQAEAAMPPPVPAGTDEAECLASLADMAAEARALEAKIVEQMAKLAEEEAALRIEQEETEVAKAVAADLAAQRDAHGDMAETSSRFADSAAWAQHAIALLQPLGGVTVLKADKDELDLQLSAAYPTVAVAGGCVGACRTGTHRLTVQLDPSSGAVTGATLFPGDIDAADIVEAAIAGSRGPDFVVREVQSRLSGVLHRLALAQDAQGRFPGASTDLSGITVTAPVVPASGQPAVLVQAVMDQSWPSGDDVVRIAAVTGAPPGAGEGCVGMHFEGVGFTAALEAAQRELAAHAEAQSAQNARKE